MYIFVGSQNPGNKVYVNQHGWSTFVDKFGSHPKIVIYMEARSKLHQWWKPARWFGGQKEAMIATETDKVTEHTQLEATVPNMPRA